jgi:hypothetical protein
MGTVPDELIAVSKFHLENQQLVIRAVCIPARWPTGFSGVKRICPMTKRSLVAQLRYHAVPQGDFSVTEMDDNAILKKYSGACVTNGALNRLIEISLDHEHLRALWKDLNGSLAKIRSEFTQLDGP